MTRREKVMATTLIAVMAVLGSGVLFHMFVYQPIDEVREQIKLEEEKLQKARADLKDQEDQITEILHVDPRLAQWQKISLPPRNPEAKKTGVTPEEQQKRHRSELQVEYERYISEMLRKNGFAGDTIVVSPRTGDNRASPILRAKEPVYDRMSFSVTARGDLEAVLRSLKDFHQANLLHQVRDLTLSVAQARGRTVPAPGTLDLSMTVEALMVNGAEDRKSLLPEKLSYPLRVLSPERKYATMLRRNMFAGISLDSTEDDPSIRESVENKKDVLSFVKLTMLCYDTDKTRSGWNATFYDQGKGGDEIVVNRFSNELKIVDQGENTLLDATVVLIDSRQLIFKVENKYYRMYCGDFLYPSMATALTKDELKELGIKP
jgi:hypothetical protein